MPIIEAFKFFDTAQVTISTPETAQIMLTADNTDQFIIKALPDNDDPVYVGKIGVDDTNGFPLFPGDTISLEIDQIGGDLHGWAVNSGNKLAFFYGTYRDFS